jgi:hypothetical protein
MRGRTRRSWRIAAASLAAATALLTGATTAPAGGLRDFSVVPVGSSLTSSASRTLTAGCPATKYALGGAAFVSPALGNLGLFSAGVAGPNWVAGAGETDSESAAWRLNARAFCAVYTATPPPLNGAAGYAKAVEIVRKHSDSSSAPGRAVTVPCPGGKTAISGGGRIAPPNIDVGLTALQRVNANTAWRVAAHEVDATGAEWTLYASVICANVTTETPTSDYATGYASPNMQFPLSSMPLQSVAPSCQGGAFTVGGGALVQGATPGQPPPSGVVLTSSEPLGAGWLAIAHETDPTTATWRVSATAICSPLNGGPPA